MSVEPRSRQAGRREAGGAGVMLTARHRRYSLGLGGVDDACTCYPGVGVWQLWGLEDERGLAEIDADVFLCEFCGSAVTRADVLGLVP